MQEERPLKRLVGKQRVADLTGVDGSKYSSLKGYTDAICQLWRGQVARGIASPARHPRGDLVKNLLSSHRRESDRKRRGDRVDRGSNTISDTYSHDKHGPEDVDDLWEVQLNDLVMAIDQQTTTLLQAFHNMETSLNRRVDSLNNKIDSLISGRFVFQFQPVMEGNLEGARDAQQSSLPTPSPSSSTSVLLQPPTHPSASITLPLASQPAVTTQPPTSAVSPAIPSFYRMNRELRTARQLWDEWFTGINGGPSIDQMNQKWGSKWRADAKENNFYSRRKAIIDEISKRTVAGNWQAAVAEVDLMREQAGDLSLDKLITMIKNSRKQ